MKEISDLTQNPNLISGIHNYCDRWCERCPFTARCLLYAAEEADPDADPASRDISNAAFWQKLASIFEETKQMISEWAKANGVGLSPTVLAEAQAQDDRYREEAEDHPLAHAAKDYAQAVNQWFAKEFPQIEEFDDRIPEQIETSKPYEDIEDYVEVIRWYQFFIAAKTIRGLLSRLDEDDYFDDKHSRDSEGSIKVALIAIDRSVAAWKRLSELCPESAGLIHNLLLDLERLRVNAETEFPGARGFIRPGFDENLDTLH